MTHLTHKSCTWWPLKRAWKRVIWLQLIQNKLWINIFYYTFWCVVSLSIFASCAVFWRARMASKNTNNAASEMLYNRTVLRGFFTVKNVFNLNKRGRFTFNTDRLIILKLLLFEIIVIWNYCYLELLLFEIIVIWNYCYLTYFLLAKFR